MNSNEIDRRVVLSGLLIAFGVHFLLQAFPQSGYHFGILVPLAVFVIFLGIYGAATSFHHGLRDSTFWSALLGFVGLIVLLQATDVIHFDFTTFAGTAIVAAGCAVLLASLLDATTGKPSRNGFLWGVLAIGVGVVVFLSGLEVFSQQTVDIIRKSTVGGLFVLLGLAVLVKGGKK